MNQFGQIVILVFRRHDQVADRGLVFFATVAQSAFFRDQFFAFGTDLKIQELDFLEARFAKPKAAAAARDAGDGEESV